VSVWRLTENDIQFEEELCTGPGDNTQALEQLAQVLENEAVAAKMSIRDRSVQGQRPLA